MKAFKARAPLRLGLAGGGTDVSPFADRYGGFVLNSTIDRYAYALLVTRDESSIRFISTDQAIDEALPLCSSFQLTGKLDLHKAVYNYMVEQFNGGVPIPIELSTFCDAPAGSGLGSSSTLVVAMVCAFAELLELKLDKYELAHIAFKIERIECNMQGGRQDQYAAAFGGVNFMEFYDDNRVIVSPLQLKKWVRNELESSLLLYSTGVSRESAAIISEQSKNIRENAATAMEAMHQIKNEALIMKDCLLNGDFIGLERSVRMSWRNKRLSAKSVSNPEIDTIYEAARASGAVAGKVSGAGGGGFMWFIVPIEKRANLTATLKRFGGQISNCHFSNCGAESWQIN